MYLPRYEESLKVALKPNKEMKITWLPDESTTDSERYRIVDYRNPKICNYWMTFCITVSRNSCTQRPDVTIDDPRFGSGYCPPSIHNYAGTFRELERHDIMIKYLTEQIQSDLAKADRGY